MITQTSFFDPREQVGSVTRKPLVLGTLEAAHGHVGTSVKTVKRARTQQNTQTSLATILGIVHGLRS